jgi:hypothetical protein
VNDDGVGQCGGGRGRGQVAVFGGRTEGGVVMLGHDTSRAARVVVAMRDGGDGLGGSSDWARRLRAN